MKLVGTKIRPVDPKLKEIGPHQAIGSGLWCAPSFDEWAREVVNEKRWLIPGFVPAESFVLISGQQKRAMKTFFAMTSAVSLVTNTATSMLQPVGDFPVLFIEEEGARVATKARMLGICKTLKVDPFAKSRPLRHLYFAHRRGVKVDSQRWAKELSILVKREKIALVVLDAIADVHSGDENKVQDMSTVIDAFKDMQNAGASVMYLAHLDKTRGEDKKADHDTQVRGTGLLTTKYDLHLAFRRYNRKDAHIDLFRHYRDGVDALYRVAWQINSHTEGHGAAEQEIIDLAQLSMIEVQDENDVPRMSKKLCEKLESGKVYSPKELRHLWGVGTKTAKEVITHLIEQALLEPSGESFLYEA